MKRINKIIAMLCVATLIAVPILFSCGGGNDGETSQNNTTTQADENTSGEDNPVEEDPRLSVSDDLPEINFEGAKFSIIYPTWSMYNDYYFAEEEIGEKLNDAVYRRQKDVEERFNMEIVPVTHGYIDTVPDQVSRSVRAGSDDYQLALTHCISGVVSLTTNGYAYDWNTIPHINFDKPWWNQRMNEEMSIDGILLTAVSDFIIFDPNVIYFNKQLAKELDLGDLYSMVRDGKWTWAKLTEMAKTASKDLNGDGAFSADDQYGLVTHTGWMMDSVLQSCDYFTTKRDDYGIPVCNLDSEKYVNIIEMIHELVWGDYTFRGTWDANNPADTYESQVPMSSGRVLFHVDPLSAGKRYRAYDVEFGILPFPKYDEAQQEYLSLSWNGFMVLPRTVDPEFAGVIVEALSAESYKKVLPAYYDVLLTSKVARDEESSEMIDILYKGACYDFGLNYGDWGIGFTVSNQLGSNRTPTPASFIEKNENSYNKQLLRAYDKITENYSN